MNQMLTSASGSVKSFWARPEGKVSTVVVAALLGFAFVAFGAHIAPLIALAFANIFNMIVSGVAVGTLLWLVLSKRVQVLYVAFWRNLLGKLMPIYAIDVMKEMIGRFRNHIRDLEERIQNVRGNMRTLSDMIERNTATHDKAMALAESANKQGSRDQKQLNLRMADRRKAANAALKEAYNKLDVVYKIMLKGRDICQLRLADLEDEVLVKEQEWKGIKAANSGLKSALRILTNGNSEKEMYDEALMAGTQQASLQLGEVEALLDMSKNVIEAFDVETGELNARGVKMLEKWEQGDSLIFGQPEKQELVALSNGNTDNSNRRYLELQAAPGDGSAPPQSQPKPVPRRWLKDSENK